MLSQLEPEGGWGSWAGLSAGDASGRVWPPSRGHGFAPSALSAAIAEASRSIRTGNGSGAASGGAASKPKAIPQTLSAGASGGSQSVGSGTFPDAGPQSCGDFIADHALLCGPWGDRGISGNPAADRGLWD